MPRNETYRDVHIDRPLTNFSIALWQDHSVYVAQTFFPVVPVTNASDTYTTYPQGYFNRIYETARSEDGKANSVGYKTLQDSYSCGEDALRIFISDKKRANVDSQRNLDYEANEVVLNAMLMGKEKKFSDTFLATSKWSRDVQGVAAGPTGAQVLSWADSSADPVGDVLNEILTMTVNSGGLRPNKALMTLDVYLAVREHSAVLDRVKYGGTNERPGQVSLQALAALFELDELVIMQTVLNSAVDGIEDSVTGLPPVSNAFLATQKMLLVHATPTVGLYKPVAACTFAWNQYIAMGVNAGPAVRRYRESPAIKGEYIEAELSIDQKLVAADLGTLMYDLLAVA